MLKHLRSRTADKNLLQKGFTLVELLVVIVILGILAAVVVFAVGGTEDNAKVQACLAERSSLEAAVEAWKSVQPDGAAAAPDLSDLQKATAGAPTALVRRTPVYWDVNGGLVVRGGTGDLGNLDDKCQP